MSETRFSDLTLSEPILLALQDIGYEKPTPVQESSIPLVASGRDIMVQSQTGTGKTAAFGIPILEAVEPTKGVKALVLCPTRELAKQVADELERIGKRKQVRTVPVYGGASIDKQVAEMKFAHIVAGTPGRVLDHLKRKTLDLSKLELLVLDEADEMLSMGFAKELEDIMRFVPKTRQTLLFSATIPPDIKRYAKRYMQEPEFLSLIEENVASDDVSHRYYMVSGVGRPRDLIKVIDFEQPQSAIIFCNTRKETELVARYLQKHDLDGEYLNSDLSQRDRERIMKRMKEKTLRFLVATDIAARGIDISQLSHVINYVLPESLEVYIHRTGRTGRAGVKGTAISLIGPREIGVYYYLRRIYQVALEEKSLPTKAEIELQRSRRTSDKLAQEIKSSALATPDAAAATDAAKLLERDDAQDLVAILLDHYRSGRTAPKANVPAVGGVLKDVPKPDHIAPGALPQTLAGVASRVAIIRGEFRGVDETAAESTSSTQEATDTAKPAETAKPKKAAPKKATPKDASAEESKEEPAPKRTPRTRQARPKKTESVSATSEGSTEAQEIPRAKTARAAKAADKKPKVDKSAKTTSTSSRAKTSLKDRLASKMKSMSQPPKKAAPETPTKSVPKAKTRLKPARESAPTQDAPPQDAPPPKKSTRDTNVEGSRLFISLGRKDGYNAQHLRDLIAELGGLLPEDILSTSVRPRFSFLVVDSEYCDDLIEAINGERVKGRLIRIERAREDG